MYQPAVESVAPPNPEKCRPAQHLEPSDQLIAFSMIAARRGGSEAVIGEAAAIQLIRSNIDVPVIVRDSSVLDAPAVGRLPLS
jgi:hypothetical protein